MKKILEGPSRRVGTIFQDVDANVIEVCNSILRIVFPDHTLKGYAETEPAQPTLFDCYLVKEEAAPLWGLTVEKDDLLNWNGLEWEILPFKITEINQALQFMFFDADKIEITAIDGLAANEVQQALAEIAAALVIHGILTINPGSGSV